MATPQAETRKGYVYVLSNRSMPSLVKVGRSVNGGRTRAKDLYQTGVPTPFSLEFEILVDDPVEVELLAHEALSSYRVNHSREFFRVSADRATRAVISAHLKATDERICIEDEYEAVDGAILVAHDAGMLWIDGCHAIAWLRPDELEAAHERRMAAEGQLFNEDIKAF